jgi:hypothetical protein
MAGEIRSDFGLTTAAPPTGTIHGTVTSSAGGVIDGATVKLRTVTGTPVAHTITNPAGNYVFNGIPAGTYKVNAAMPGYVTSPYSSVTLQGGAILEVDFTLTPESRSRNVLYGTVTNQSTSAVISNACIALIPDISTLTNLNMGKSNASGQFMLDQIPDGTQNLGVSANGFYLSAFRSITISGGTILRSNAVLQPYALPQATVSGVITNQTTGAPIANACVGLYSLGAGGAESLQQVTFSDSNGVYVFSRAAAGTYVIKAKVEQGI